MSDYLAKKQQGRRIPTTELLIILILGGLVYLIAIFTDVHQIVDQWADNKRFLGLKLVELLVALTFFAIAFSIFGIRRWREANYEITERMVAEERLRNAEESYRTLFEQSPDGIVVIDPETTLSIMFNDVACRQLGYSREEFAKLHISNYEAKETSEEIKAHIEKVLREGQDTFETKHRTKSGEIRNILVTAKTITISGQKNFHCIFRDITTLKRAEEALKSALQESQLRQKEISALLESSRVIMEYHEFKDAAQLIFGSCKNLIGADAGYVAMLSKDGTRNELLFLDAGGRSCSVDPLLPMPIRGLRGEVHRSGKTIYHNNFSDSEWGGFMPQGHVKLDNVLFAPLITNGKVSGLLGLANKPGGFTEQDARMASAFGELAAIALLNSRTLELLKEATKKAQKYLDIAGVMIVVIGANQKVSLINKKGCQVLGYEENEIIGKNWFDIFIPIRMRQDVKSTFTKLIAGDIKPVEYFENPVFPSSIRKCNT